MKASLALLRPKNLVAEEWLRRAALIALPLSSGAALIAFIVLHIPLGLAVAGLALPGAAAWAYVIPRLSRGERSKLVRNVVRGAIVAPFSIAAYDLTRYGLVAVASMSFQPFHALPLFGQALLGADAPMPVAALAGVAFHVVNGTGFAIAFAVAVDRPSPLRGIAWALGLEALMLLLYPGWLGVSLTGELLPVSLAGHVAYGGVLGTALARFSP
jgi:hypothetical protein